MERGLVIRQYEPGDEDAILEAYNRILAAPARGLAPRTAEYWRWQYLENPAGWRIWLALTPDGRVVNQQAGVPRRVLFDGVDATWNQVVDSFRDPALGRGLKKPGLFTVAAMPYSDNYGGAPPERDPIMYGVPSRSALRIGHKFLGYDVVRSQSWLRLTPDRFAAEPAPSIDIDEVDVFPDEVGDLFQRAAAIFRAATVRDARYLNWRFCAHPEGKYRIALARRAAGDRPLVGFTVSTRGSCDGVAGGLIADWLVDPAEPAAGRALRGWLAEQAFGRGDESLTALFPESCPDWLEFQRAGYRVEAASSFLVGRSYVRAYDLRWLFRHWYYTLGDTDLC